MVVIEDDQGKIILKGKCVNGRLAPEIVHSPIYHDIIERDPSMADIYKFIRRYSPDHRRKYPHNATYEGTAFYLAESEEQHKPALDLYEIFKERTGGTFEDFRKVVQ